MEARSEEEVIRAVREVRERGGRLRAAGAGGSKNRILDVPGGVLRLDGLEAPWAVGDGEVTAPASMTVGALHDRLRAEGLLVPTVGEWRNATLAGSLATASHGGSARHGILSTSVRSLRLVTGTGEVVRLSRGEEDFVHAGVSLGALGVVTAVTLECVERFPLRLETDVVGFAEYLADPVGQESRSEFHASIWAPHARRVIRFAADRTRDPIGRARRELRFGYRTGLATYVSRHLGVHGGVSSRVFRRTAVGDAADILAPIAVASGTVHTRILVNEARGRMAAELALPASRIPEALARLEALLRVHRRVVRNPIGVRMSPADRFTLSPCYERDTFWLDIFFYDREPFVSELAAFAAEFGARCHWGKTLPRPPEALRREYPAWEAFRAARARLDPDAVFANGFTDALGLTGSRAPARAS